MKKRIPSFLAGAASALLAAVLCTSALAASGQVSFNIAGVSLNGETRIAAGESITAANGQEIPGSILYTDAAGGKTNYLPIRAISELLGVEIGYDSATRTVLLGDRAADQPAQTGARWTMTLEDGSITYQSEDGGTKYDASDAYSPAWQAESWGLSEIRGRGGFGSWIFRNGDSRITVLCRAPGGSVGYGMFADPEKAIANRRQIPIQGCAASLYEEDGESLLVWENGDGLLFQLTGRDVDAETLIQAAESLRPCSQTDADWKPEWTPEGTELFDTSAVGDTVQKIWMVNGTSMTLLAGPCSVAAQEGAPEAVQVNGREARFWAAKEPAVPEPVKTEEAGGVTITTAQISGFGAADMSTLTWSDPDSGTSFLLLGALDRDTMVRIAESVTAK